MYLMKGVHMKSIFWLYTLLFLILLGGSVIEINGYYQRNLDKLRREISITSDENNYLRRVFKSCLENNPFALHDGTIYDCNTRKRSLKVKDIFSRDEMDKALIALAVLPSKEDI